MVPRMLSFPSRNAADQRFEAGRLERPPCERISRSVLTIGGIFSGPTTNLGQILELSGLSLRGLAEAQADRQIVVPAL